MLPDILSHLGHGIPALKDFAYGLHGPDCAGDELSRQGPSIIPVTVLEARRTIVPMGRGTTPARFKNEFAVRLKAARIVAGYKTQKALAAEIGIDWERYKKWESGRTPIPHQYVRTVCDLLNIDANYLFDIESRAAKAKPTDERQTA